ncbi:hypothetical protein [Mycobacterium sp.]|uniref:hypothetical protein n=1 Tax=Mycobacterium sp. TaxID=1785 RepID=UPI002D414D7A|nr:hypothetical protein [Mycobacterium sp.]HZA10986.1 hypothetical protein [Mycobacterium sp.]
MSDASSRIPPVPAQAALREMLTASWVSRAIYVATKLGIADTLSAGPMTAAWVRLVSR